MPASWSWGNVDLMKLHLPVNSFLDTRTRVRPITHIHAQTHQQACTLKILVTQMHVQLFWGVMSTFVQRYNSPVTDWQWGMLSSVMRCDTYQVPISFAHIEVQALKRQAVYLCFCLGGTWQNTMSLSSYLQRHIQMDFFSSCPTLLLLLQYEPMQMTVRNVTES